MIGPVINLVNLLRERGVPVSTPEATDCLAALALAPAYDTATVKAVLKATLVKDRDFTPVFEEAFAGVFAPRSGDLSQGQAGEETTVFQGGDLNWTAGSGGTGSGEGRGTGRGDTETFAARLSGGDATAEGDGAGLFRPGERALLNLPFTSAGRRQREEMISLIRELSRKLAVRKGFKMKSGGVKLHFRKLWRNSLGAGGVPFDLAWRRRILNKPRVFIICDLSKSMTPFLPFVLEFVFSFAAGRSTVRVFGFVDALEEITHLIDPVDVKKSVEAVCAGARVVRRGLTDYGNAFRGFFTHHRNDLTSKTTVIVVGDARNNSFSSGADLLGEIGEMSAGIYWLNPETSDFWGMGDSYMNVYAPCCKGVFECRNIGQLRKFMELLA